VYNSLRLIENRYTPTKGGSSMSSATTTFEQFTKSFLDRYVQVFSQVGGQGRKPTDVNLFVKGAVRQLTDYLKWKYHVDPANVEMSASENPDRKSISLDDFIDSFQKDFQQFRTEVKRRGKNPADGKPHALTLNALKKLVWFAKNMLFNNTYVETVYLVLPAQEEEESTSSPVQNVQPYQEEVEQEESETVDMEEHEKVSPSANVTSELAVGETDYYEDDVSPTAEITSESNDVDDEVKHAIRSLDDIIKKRYQKGFVTIEENEELDEPDIASAKARSNPKKSKK
jgi:hypothetical protein